MAAITKKIVISGYYGFDNSGDEAVLQSILLALQASGREHNIKFEPIVLSANEQQTSKQYGVRTISRTSPVEIVKALRSADGLISGGGSLLQDVTGIATIPYYLGIIKLAQWLKKPVFIYAQGVGPVRRTLFHHFIRSVFAKAAYISVRDIESKNWLEKLGVAERQAVHLVPDPVMALPLPQSSGEVMDVSTEQAICIGVSVRFWQHHDEFLLKLGNALEQILAADSRTCVHLLPFHMPSDEQASLKLMTAISSDFHNRIQMKTCHDPQQMLATVGRCQLLIGMRLHALIYAANQQVPMIGISYDPKIDQFLARLDMAAAASTDDLQPNVIVEQANALLTGAAQWRIDKQQHLQTLMEEARFPAQAIAQYFAPTDGGEQDA